jgi:hypothetical protein
VAASLKTNDLDTMIDESRKDALHKFSLVEKPSANEKALLKKIAVIKPKPPDFPPGTSAPLH